MKPHHVLFLLTFLIGVSVGQSGFLDQLPQCAAQCVEQTISVSSCSPTDLACLCGDARFQEAAAACEAVNCTVEETLTATNATLAACGVPPKDVSNTLLTISATFGSLAILMVVLRIGDTLWDKKIALDWEDFFVVIAVVLASVMNFTCIPMALLGMGKDFWTVKLNHIDTVLELLYVAEVFYMAAEMFVQLSLLTFYLRIFRTRQFRTAVFALMGVTVCFGIANTFSMIFQCTPIPYFWQGWAGETTGKCININLFSWIRAGVEIALDLAILLLPIPQLLKLQMRLRKKIETVTMFSMGLIITLISILRLRSLIQFATTNNPTHDNTPAVYWSVLECNIFIICACMPSMRKILMRIWPKVFRSSAGQSSYYDTPNKFGTRDGLGPNSQYRRQPSADHPEPSDLDNNTKAIAIKGSAIIKSTDIDIYSGERNDSDVELMESRGGKVYGA